MPHELEFLKVLILQAWSYDGVKIIACHTLVNVVLAIATGLKSGSFVMGKVGEFLIKKLLPYVSVYFVIKVAGDTAGLGFLAPIAWTAIEATLTGDLLDNWTRLGLPLPQTIQQLVVKHA